MIGGLVALLAGHFVETAKLKAYAAALYAAAAASLLFAFVFALVALRHWIEVNYATPYPDVWMAAGFIFLAVPFIGFGVWAGQRKPKTHPAASMALLAAPSAVRLAGRGVRRMNPRVVAVGIVLVAGLAIGRRLTAR